MKVMLLQFAKQDGRDNVAGIATCSGLEIKGFELLLGKSAPNTNVVGHMYL